MSEQELHELIEALIDAGAYLLVGLMAFDWVAAVVLLIGDHAHPGVKALHERAQAQLVLALAASIFGILALNRIFILGLPGELLILGLVLGAVLVSVPGLLWLWRYLRNDW